jgi:hypothetical protein
MFPFPPLLHSLPLAQATQDVYGALYMVQQSDHRRDPALSLFQVWSRSEGAAIRRDKL